MTVSRQDILITRAVDAAATPEDWREIEALALADPSLWKRLAHEVRTHSLLTGALDAATATADAVELDPQRTHAAGAFRLRLRAWSGWAAAAVIALAWIGGAAILNSPAFPGSFAGVSAMPASAEEALDQYRALGVQEGRYLYELPMVMVDSQRDPDSERIEILYMRRILERAEISAMYTAAPDEEGKPVPVAVPVRGAAFTNPQIH